MGNPAIKNRFTGKIIVEAGKYASLKEAVEENRAYLAGAYLAGADLAGADLAGADLARAYLAGADLAGAYLAGAYLADANLARAYLAGADLAGAYLAGADLARAYLAGADLAGANLARANLADANLAGAKGISPYVCTPLLMLYDQPDKIRAYKLVTQNNEGPYQGGIIYKIGETYEVKNANTDINQQCAEGINLATLDWCIKNWQKGYKIFIAEFTAEDIACIPTATDGKFRVRKCTIVGRKTLKELGLKKN